MLKILVFVLQSVVCYINTHKLKAEVNFPQNFIKRKTKRLFTSLGQSVLGETVPSVWVKCNTDLPAGE